MSMDVKALKANYAYSLAAKLNKLGAGNLTLTKPQCDKLAKKLEDLAKKDPRMATLVVLRLEDLVDEKRLNIDKMTPMSYGDFEGVFLGACKILRTKLTPAELAMLPPTSAIPK
ncbi:MAG: hypothetical protein HY903_12195 [Deltaproteobacteria bacterium]|nr:hypothetical protein [Deltaproteobacteria bacterium]